MEVPIVGLGCSSFSTFFWDSNELRQESTGEWTPEEMDKSHPKVKEWISTIHFAIEECGVTLLDTAPWYGHGTSEVVIGWAVAEIQEKGTIDRSKLVINTKIGRYEADPKKQFDFGYETTIASVARSIQRMNCQYIDVLQVHDPEFAPSLEQLLKETVPALLECRDKGYCKAIGVTGYPLKVQYQIMQRSLELDSNSGRIWDQSLTYGHYNLGNTSLVDQPMDQSMSLADFCEANKIGVMAAAPLNMGLFTPNKLADWHPAHAKLRNACQEAESICAEHGVDIATLAIVFALSNPRIPCTILGMKNVSEVKYSYALASRFHKLDDAEDMTQTEILKEVMEDAEFAALARIRDPKLGPFTKLWKDGSFAWDGVAEAKNFWRQLEGEQQEDWHIK